MCIPFICVTLASAIRIFEKRKWACSSVFCLPLICCLCQQTTVETAETRSLYVLTFLIGTHSSYFIAHCAGGLFHQLVIKSRLVLLCHIHLFLNFSDCNETSAMCSAYILYICVTTKQSYFDQSRAGGVNVLWETDKKCIIKARKRWKETLVF